MNTNVIIACIVMFLFIGIGLSMEPNPQLLINAILEGPPK